MKILYDMCTGKFLEAPGQVQEQTEIHSQETHNLLEMRLFQITPSKRETLRFPPELACMEIDGFLQNMD